MKYSKFTAPALLAIAATGIATAPATAAPAAPAPAVEEQAAPSAQGTDRGVAYRAEIVEAGKSVVTTVTGGAFALSADATSVSLTNAAGELVAQLPLAGTVDGATTEIAATVEADGTRLTLTPKSVAADISSQQWFMDELQRASTGGLVGAAIGALLGAIGIVTIIPGAIIGGVIGLLVAGGPSLVDAGSAYFSGQP